MKQKINVNREAMNALFPEIPQDFEARMRGMIESMPLKGKEQLVKKKISAGLVLAIVLALLAIGALAATLLGGKDFVDQVMLPKAKENVSDSFTQDEVEEMIRLAKENQIVLPDYFVKRLQSTQEGYYKEELMRVFVKTEYGFYPSAWPLEVQAWYEEALEACGLGDGVINSALPGEGEITQEQALAIFHDKIRESGGDTAELADKELYLRHMTFSQQKIAPDAYDRAWWIKYDARDLYHPDYYITMDNHGVVDSFSVAPGIDGQPVPGMSIGDRFWRVYGDEYGFVSWDNDLIEKYRQALSAQAALYGQDAQMTREEKAILEQEYITPTDAMIGREEAIAIARAALEKIDETENRQYVPDQASAICLKDGEKTVWRVCTNVRAIGWGYAEVDALTGEVVQCDIDGGSIRRFVGEEYYQAHRTPVSTPEPRPTNRPDGKPWLWYSTLAPEWFWKKMDDVGYNTAEQLTEWYAEYGNDVNYWPLEAQVIYFLRFDLYGYVSEDEIMAFPGLPGEDDMQQEQAVAAAREIFRQTYAAAAPDWDYEGMDVSVGFLFHYEQRGQSVWSVQFHNGSGGPLRGYVTLEAKTGALVDIGAFDLPAAPTPTPRPDGTPWYWRSDLLTPAEWDVVERSGVTAENLAQYEEKWNAEYGDSLFWPLENHLIRDALTYGEGWAEISTLPGADDIPAQQALAAAWDALTPLYEASGRDREWMDALRVSQALLRDVVTDERCWLIQMALPKANGGYCIVGYVEVDARTGEARNAEYFGEGSNG